MELYTERHGMRKPINKTEIINIDMYALLLECCEKYKKNLTHIFEVNCHHDYTNSDYVTFNEQGFTTRIKFKIPELFRDKYDRISKPTVDDKYDQYSLLDLIEFFAQNIQDITEYWNNEQYKNFRNIDCLGTFKIFNDFKREINNIFVESGLLYELTNERIIERIVENSVLTPNIEKQVEKIKEKDLQDLLNEAIGFYKSPYPNDNKIAVEKIWDALESLKTYFKNSNKKQADQKVSDILASNDEQVAKIFEKELSELGNIGNNYHIRHYNDKQVQIADSHHYDYLFNRCLSLISLALKYL